MSGWQLSRVPKYDEETIVPTKKEVSFYEACCSEDRFQNYAYLLLIENEQLIRQRLESLQEQFHVLLSPLTITKEM